MSRLPLFVYIGPYLYQVSYLKVIEAAELDVMGQCDNTARTIKVVEGLDELEEWDTYIHELMEAINSVYALELPHSVIQTIAVALAGSGLKASKGETLQ